MKIAASMFSVLMCAALVFSVGAEAGQGNRRSASTGTARHTQMSQVRNQQRLITGSHNCDGPQVRERKQIRNQDTSGTGSGQQSQTGNQE